MDPGRWRITCERAESSRERRIARHKSNHHSFIQELAVHWRRMRSRLKDDWTNLKAVYTDLPTLSKFTIECYHIHFQKSQFSAVTECKKDSKLMAIQSNLGEKQGKKIPIRDQPSFSFKTPFSSYLFWWKRSPAPRITHFCLFINIYICISFIGC